MIEEIAEKRFHPRKKIETYVLYRIEGEKEFTSRHSINISPGGVLLETEKPLAKGTKLELHFSLPNSPQLIKAKGQIVWSEEKREETSEEFPSMHYLSGIEFTQISDDFKKIIQDFLKKNSGKNK